MLSKLTILIIGLILIALGTGSSLPGVWTLNIGNVALMRALMTGEPSAEQRAVAWLTTAAERHRQAGAYRSLTILGLAEGRSEQATETGERATELAPSDSMAGYWLGQAYWETGQKDAAREVWRVSGYTQARLDRLVWLCWHDVGQGNLDAAEAALMKAIDLDPEYGPAYDALASVLWGQRWDKVRWALERAIAYLPEGTAAWHWNVGRLYLLDGDWERAAQALRASVELAPAEWPMRFLADALEHAGDTEGAAQVQAEIERRWGK